MAFKIYSTDDNRVPGIEYLPASAITPKVGMALTQTTGQLALATGATAPTYISMCEKDGECTAGDIIPVIRVGKDMILETTFAAAATSIKRCTRTACRSRPRPPTAWRRWCTWTAPPAAACAACASKNDERSTVNNG